MVQSHLPPFRNLSNFVHLTLPVSFGRDTKSWWSLLSGVYARGSKRPHTGGKCVTCCGLTNSRWTLNALQRALSSIWEKEKESRKRSIQQQSVGAQTCKGMFWVHSQMKHNESDTLVGGCRIPCNFITTGIQIQDFWQIFKSQFSIWIQTSERNQNVSI